jgi:hypothetical protein
MRTRVKLIVLIAIVATTLTGLFWVNQKNVREVGPTRPPAGQASF